MNVTVNLELSGNGVDDDPNHTFRRLRRTCEYIESQFSQHLKLEYASTYTGMERTYFSRTFKRCMGIGFAAWLRELRIAYAKELLCRSDSGITEVAMIAGFNDVSTFERGFRDSLGLSPREFRTQVHSPAMESGIAEYFGGF